MRHPHGLRAASARLPEIGDAYQGGFFAGLISYAANSVATHGLIVAPAATGASGTGYTIATDLQWKTSNTLTSGTSSPFDGLANSNSMNNALHPAAQFCRSLSIGGYSDWYLPARYELDIAYENLKPTASTNSTVWGINPYSVPESTVNRTSGDPAQTPLAAFQSGGSEAFSVARPHWSSTEFSTEYAWGFIFGDVSGFPSGFQISDTGATTKAGTSGVLRIVRAFRKFAL